MTLKPSLIRLLPIGVGLLVAALVIVPSWVVPTTHTETTQTQIQGVEQVRTLTASSERHQELEWAFDVNVPEEAILWPRLPYRVNRDGDGPRESSLQIDFHVFLNGQPAWHARLTHQADATTVSPHGVPGRMSDVDQSALRPGWNSVRVLAVLTLDIQEPGAQVFTIEAGPVVVNVLRIDGDGDGVVDAHQWFPVHTGYVVIPAAVVLGGLSAWGTRRWSPFNRG